MFQRKLKKHLEMLQQTKKKKCRQRKDLVEVLKLLVLTDAGKCIYDELENAVCDPFVNQNIHEQNFKCINGCPIRSNIVGNYILPIKKLGCKIFLLPRSYYRKVLVKMLQAL